MNGRPLSLEDILEALARAGSRIVKHSGYWKAQCPSHRDPEPSLSVTPMPGGTVRLKCFAGCATRDVLAALDLTGAAKATTRPRQRSPAARRAQSSPEPLPAPKPLPRGWQRWIYRDADGGTVFAVVRRDHRTGKDIRQWTPHPDGGGWIPKGPKGLAPIYDLPELLVTDPASTLVIVEGEKCMDAARDEFPGQFFTTWAGGTNAWDRTDWSPLAGRKVWLIADGDPIKEDGPMAGKSVGHECMRDIAKVLDALGCEVWLTLPETDGTDIADWIAHSRQLATTRIRAGKFRYGQEPEPLPEPDSQPEPEPEPSEDYDHDAADLAAETADPLTQAKEVLTAAGDNVLADNEHFRILGLNHDSDVVISVDGAIKDFTRSRLMKVDELLGLAADTTWWCRRTGEESLSTTVARTIGSELVRIARQLGKNDLNRIRGRGAVRTAGNEIVFHLGDRIYDQGRFIELRDDDRMVWASEARLELGDPASIEQRQRFANAVMEYRWRTPDDGRRLLGWLVAALVGGALRWRPHLMYVAPASSGKSWILEHVIEQLFEPWYESWVDVSAAALARERKYSSLPVVADEAEPDAPWVPGFVQALRFAAGGKGTRLRAASDGGVDKQHYRFCALMAATKRLAMNDADSSRMSMVRLGPEVDDWPALEREINLAGRCADLLRNAIIRDAHLIVADAEQMTVRLEHEGVGSREAHLGGALTAGWRWWQVDDQAVTTGTDLAEATDAEDALDEILWLTQRMPGGREVSLLSLLRSAWKPDRELVEDLYGLRRDDDGSLLIAPTHKRLIKELQRWRSGLSVTDLRELLSQIEGVWRTTGVRIGAMNRTRCLRFEPKVLIRLGYDFTLRDNSHADSDPEAEGAPEPEPMPDQEMDF